MSRYQVTAIRRDRAQPGCLIEAVVFAGQVYEMDDAMRWLNASPDNQLWVVDDSGNSVWVSARQHLRTGRYFLTTERGGKPLNELESLPECREDGSCSVFRFGRSPAQREADQDPFWTRRRRVPSGSTM
jgi:hypothetical protein